MIPTKRPAWARSIRLWRCRHDGGRNGGEAVCDENGLAVTQLGRPPVAPTNKSLAQINKSSDVGKATKKRRPYGGPNSST